MSFLGLVRAVSQSCPCSIARSTASPPPTGRARCAVACSTTRIRRRALDRSFQHYLHALLFGLAFLEVDVFPPVWSENETVNIPAMESLPNGHGYTELLAILPHEAGAHRGGHAFRGAPVNGISGWARVAMFTTPLMTTRQSVGVWGQELIHLLGNMWDHTGLDGYDVMNGDGARRGTHACANTKILMGWLSAGVLDYVDGALSVGLHAIGQAQPPPVGRVTAVRVASQLSANRFIVEGRAATDQFDWMVPAEGVLVYEIADMPNGQNVDLRTAGALSKGQTFDKPAEGLRVTVDDTLAGGFAVTVRKAMPRLVDLQVAGVTSDGGMWHTIRHDMWWDGFGDVKGQAGGHPGKFDAVGCAKINGELHLCGITSDGGMWHAIRRDTGWVGFGDVKGQAGRPSGQVRGGRLRRDKRRAARVRRHSDGGMWHTIRHETQWDGFGDVKGQAGTHPGSFGAVGCAAVNGELHVCGITNDGGMWHAIRRDAGWIGFGDVKGQAEAIPAGSRRPAAPGSTASCTCAASPVTAACGTPSDTKPSGTDSAMSRARPEPIPAGLRRSAVPGWKASCTCAASAPTVACGTPSAKPGTGSDSAMSRARPEGIPASSRRPRLRGLADPS